MKRYLKIFMILAVLLSFSFLLFYFLYFVSLDEDSIFAQGSRWILKKDEIKSRLLSIPILLYHNIDGKGPFSIDLDIMRKHFQLLRTNNVRVIKLSELIERLEDPSPFDEKTVVISFDDGYFSMHTKLLPLVKEFGYPVTLFVYTDIIFNRAENSLTWKHLQEMEKAGIEVECHSISHSDLNMISKLETPENKKKLFEEIYLSKRIMELYLKKKIKYFAFPYGRYNLNLVEMCRRSGYRRVFSTDYGTNIITRNNYCLRRRHIKSDYSLEYIESLIK